MINWPNCWGIGSRHFKQSGGFLTWVLIFMSLGSQKKRGYTNLVFKRKTWGFNRFQYSPSLNLGVILSIFRQTQLFCAQSEGQWQADGLCPQRWDGVTATASHSVERWLAFASTRAPRGAPPHMESLWSPGSILPKWVTGPPGDYKGLWKYQLTQMPSVRFASDKAWALCLKCCGSALSREKLWETLVFSSELWVVSDILRWLWCPGAWLDRQPDGFCRVDLLLKRNSGTTMTSPPFFIVHFE